MGTDRATPRAAPSSPNSLNLEMPNEPVKAVQETGKLLLRMPGWLKPMIQDKADSEGISMNLWVSRMLAEAVKSGTQSQPYVMPPRNLYKEAEVDDLVIDTAISAAEQAIRTWETPKEPKSYTYTPPTGDDANPAGIGGTWSTPDGDIPDLS